MLVLCIGDLHIPHRASDLAPKFKALLVPGKIHHILCTGNLCSEASCALGLGVGGGAPCDRQLSALETLFHSVGVAVAPKACMVSMSTCGRHCPDALFFCCLLYRVFCWFSAPVCPQSVYEYLRSVCSDVRVVQGDFDEDTKWPDSEVGIASWGWVHCPMGVGWRLAGWSAGGLSREHQVAGE